MLLFKEAHEDVNVIHVIMGHETEFQFDMAGHIIIDISENIDATKKNIIFINRCKSEEELQAKLNYYQKKWSKKTSDNEEEKSDDKIEKNHNKHRSEVIEQKYGKFIAELKCPKCGCLGTFSKDGVVTACALCKKIDDGLKAKTIPPHPSKKEMDDIVKSFFDKKEQKKDG